MRAGGNATPEAPTHASSVIYSLLPSCTAMARSLYINEALLKILVKLFT